MSQQAHSLAFSAKTLSQLVSLSALIDRSSFAEVPPKDFIPMLTSLIAQTDQEKVKINGRLQKMFNAKLMEILAMKIKEDGTASIAEGAIDKLKVFLSSICQCLGNSIIQPSLILSLLENILECLGISDLSQILPIITSQICSFGSTLTQTDQFKLLRIINHLLKRISKTQDYSIRGQLQFALTKFLPICHDSGFHYKSTGAARISEQMQQREDKNDQVQLGKIVVDLQQGGVSYQFYERFWDLQKYFGDLSEFTGESANSSQSKSNSRESLVLLKLKNIQSTLKDLFAYFSTHPSKAAKFSLSHPIKFLKNYSLLSLQLSDPYFRETILLQTIIFAQSLKIPSVNNKITLGEEEKSIVDDIQKNSIKQLSKQGQNSNKLIETISKLLENQRYWIDLKDNWKQRKKNFYKLSNQAESQKQPSALTSTKSLHSQLEKKQNQTDKFIAQKLKIDGTNLLKFLQAKEPIQLLEQPTRPSFSYFFPQAQRCLDTFDYESSRQTQFQTRSQYNLFEWKAMRSLYRQNLRDVHINMALGSNEKLRQYRLISLMNMRKDQIYEAKTTQNEEQRQNGNGLGQGETLRKIVKENQQ